MFSAATVPPVQTVRSVAPGLTSQVRIVGPGAAVVRAPTAPGALVQQRVIGPLRGQPLQQTRMVSVLNDIYSHFFVFVVVVDLCAGRKTQLL